MAIEKFEAALKANPNNMAAYLGLGYLYQNSGKKYEAVAAYEKALKRQPNYWIAANNIAALLSEPPNSKKDLDRALELARHAQTLRPDEPTIQDTLGWTYYQMGDFAQAVDHLDKALAKHPEESVFNYHMGMALYKSGKKEAAKEKLAKAVAGSGNFTGKKEAKRVLKEL